MKIKSKYIISMDLMHLVIDTDWHGCAMINHPINLPLVAMMSNSGTLSFIYLHEYSRLLWVFWRKTSIHCSLGRKSCEVQLSWSWKPLVSPLQYFFSWPYCVPVSSSQQDSPKSNILISLNLDREIIIKDLFIGHRSLWKTLGQQRQKQEAKVCSPENESFKRL